MDKNSVLKALESLGESKKGFTQSVDLIVNLKEINLKNPDEQVDFFYELPHGLGKKKKICGLVGPELAEDAKTSLDFSLTQIEFEKLDKKAVKKLAEQYDYFVAQANIMPKVAAVFGRILGPRNKMPNPKAGCVVPPKANLSSVHEKLVNTVRCKAKVNPVIQVAVGHESQNNEELAENIMAIYDAIVHHLPKELNNVGTIFIKKTMSKAVQVN